MCGKSVISVVSFERDVQTQKKRLEIGISKNLAPFGKKYFLSICCYFDLLVNIQRELLPDPPENCHLNVKNCQKHFDNFLTFKWQFSEGSDYQVGIYI